MNLSVTTRTLIVIRHIHIRSRSTRTVGLHLYHLIKLSDVLKPQSVADDCQQLVTQRERRLTYIQKHCNMWSGKVPWKYKQTSNMWIWKGSTFSRGYSIFLRWSIQANLRHTRHLWCVWFRYILSSCLFQRIQKTLWKQQTSSSEAHCLPENNCWIVFLKAFIMVWCKAKVTT